MIEAVNSVLSNATLLRGNAEQAASSKQNLESVKIEASGNASELPSAPFISPRIALDLDYNKSVLQIRDAETGDVLSQFPSEKTLAYRTNQAAFKPSDISVPAETDGGGSGDTSGTGGVQSAPVQSNSTTAETTVNAEAQAVSAEVANGSAQGNGQTLASSVNVTA